MKDSGSVREVVLFKLAPGVDRAALEDAVRTTSASLRTLQGFVTRELFHDADHDTWLDVVTWSSRDAAVRAQEAFPTLAGADALMQAIDPETITMLHAEPVPIPDRAPA